MPIHRSQLPIVNRCEGFVPAPGARGEEGFCERCQQQVHDVSAMRETELRAFLAAREGTRVCLSYRVDDHGYLRLRSEPGPVAASVLALMLACAPRGGEAEAPSSDEPPRSSTAGSCSVPGPVVDASVPVRSPPPGTDAKARVDFLLDPTNEFGGVLVRSWIERDFVPTDVLWRDWLRRRAQRRAARLRRRHGAH